MLFESRNRELHNPFHVHQLFGVFAAVIAATLGCNRQEAVAPKKEVTAAGVTLKLLVVSDPEIAKQIGQLRGEWQAQTDGDLEVREISEDELNKSTKLDADAVIYPAQQLGSLVAAKLILPISKQELGSKELQEPDIFDLVRSRDITWGQSAFAVPFGSPAYLLLYRSDLLGNHPVPATWKQLAQLSAELAPPAEQDDAANGGKPAWSPTLEPLAEGWAGRTLLARAAAYAKHRDYYAALFQSSSMEPQIGTDPFVRALEEIVAAAKLAAVDQTKLSPADVRREFLLGRAGFALTWPSGADVSPNDPAPLPSFGIAEMPGATEVFHPDGKSWQKRARDESEHVTFLTGAGRIGSVTAESAHPAAAFDLLARLSGEPWGNQVSASSRSTAIYRKSQLANVAPWMIKNAPADASTQYGESMASTLSRANSLSAVTLPGQARYMAALDQAVLRAVRGEQSAKDSLAAAAKEWSTITADLGIEKQRQAYAESLGLQP